MLTNVNEALSSALSHLGKPGPRGANMVSIMRTSSGNVMQTLTNTIGPRALWAFSTTSEDMTVRNALYKRIGVTRTLKVLSKYWPGGIKTEVERRKVDLEKTDLEKGVDVYQPLIDELLELAYKGDIN